MALLGVTMAHRLKMGFFGADFARFGPRQAAVRAQTYPESVQQCSIMWVSRIFGLPGTYLGVLGHFQVVKVQKPVFLGHF